MKAGTEIIDVKIHNSLDDLFSVDFLAEIEEKSQYGICCAYVTEEEEL